MGADALFDGAMDAPTDTGTASPEDSGPSECPVGVAFAQGSAEGASDPTMVPAGMGPGGAVRAGRLTAAALPVDRTGLSTWQAGDGVLANNRVALLIEAARPTSGYNPWGGTPVGVASVRDGRLVDAGDFSGSSSSASGASRCRPSR